MQGFYFADIFFGMIIAFRKLVYIKSFAMKYFVPFLLILTVWQSAAQERLFSRQLNNSSYNVFAPSISGDGKSILFIGEFNMDGEPVMYFSENKGGWSEHQDLPKSISLTKVNNMYGHFLDYSGKRIYFSNRRSGSYSIWYSDRREDGSWGVPDKLPEPISSMEHEISPSLDPEGNEMYFCRCEKVDPYTSKGCKIYYSRLEGEEWSEPEALPDYINFGNTAAPKILNDESTLYYSVQTAKGDYDMYMTRKDGGVWSRPVAMEFVNSEHDEVFVSVNFYGVLMTMGRMSNGKYQLFDVVVPEQFRSHEYALMDFELERDYEQFYVRMKLFGESGELIKQDKLTAGNVKIILPEGQKYHLLIQPAHASRVFYSRVIDVTDLSRAIRLEEPIKIVSVNRGDSFIVEGFKFSAEYPYISDQPEDLYRSLSLFLRGNKDKQIEMNLVMTNYKEDSVMGVDMTEVRIDSTLLEMAPDTVWADGTIPMDALEMSIAKDTILVDSLSAESTIELDSGSNIIPMFTLLPRSRWVKTYTYHNDRTEKEAETMKTILESLGVPAENIFINGLVEMPVENKPERFIRINIK